jgi:spore germination protein GerM
MSAVNRIGSRVLVVLLAAGGVAACGIPADDGPRAISPDNVPVDDEGTATTEEGQTLVAPLFFTRFDGNREELIEVEREVPTGGSSPSPSPATVLEALLAGPGEEAEAEHIVTKIPAATALASPPALAGGVLTVDLNPAIRNVQSDGARLAYGQLVCTAGALPGVDAVLFTVEGEPLRPPTGDGETSSAPLTCDAYANLRDN